MVQSMKSTVQGVSGSPRVVACIPAYNEESYIGSIVLRTTRFVTDVIVCNDGSKDLTGEIAEKLGAIVITHPRNQGKGSAIRSAISHALSLNPDVIVVLDADGQHQPENIPLLVEPVYDGSADVVIGSRFLNKSDSEAPTLRKYGIKIIDKFLKQKVSGDVSDTQSGFRAYSQKAARVMLNTRSDGFGIESEQLILIEEKGFNITEVPITIRYKNISKTSTKNLFIHGSEVMGSILITVIEERPLLFLGGPGVLSSICGVLLMLYIVILYNNASYFSMPLALISVGFILIGLLLIVSSLILYSQKKILNKLDLNNR